MCDLTGNPIRVWNLVRVLRAMPDAEPCETGNDGWQWWNFDQHAMCTNANA